MWTEKNNALDREFEFADFSETWAFMSRVALLAETLGHHPTWTNTYNKLHIRLNTHDAGDIITAKDRDMAKHIDKLLQK